MGFLEARFAGWGVLKLPPLRLKLVKIMLKTSNLACKYKPICSFIKSTFYYLDPIKLADVSTFCKNLAFFNEKSTSTQGNSVRALLEIF